LIVVSKLTYLTLVAELELNTCEWLL